MASLPAAAGSHHTVWVQRGDDRPVAVRYATSGGRIVCFGDDRLADLADGTRLTVAIHDIAGGPALASFGATLREVGGDQVDREALLDLLAHVPLGRTIEEVEEAIARVARTRRIVELVP